MESPGINREPLRQRIVSGLKRFIPRRNREAAEIVPPAEDPVAVSTPEIPQRPQLPVEKPNEAYETDYARENEIKELMGLLDTHPAVMVLGQEGRGKSTFFGEAMDAVAKQGTGTRFFDGHYIDNVLVNSFSKNRVQNSTEALSLWIRKQEKDAPIEKRPVLFVDAADALFLQSHWIYGRGFPYYGSDQWYHWQKMSDAEFTQMVREKEYDELTERREKAMRDYPSIPRRPIEQEFAHVVDSWRAKLEVPTVKAALLNDIQDGLLNNRIRVVAADHDYPREKLAKNNYLSPHLLLDMYDRTFKTAYRYELPAAYEPNRARIFIAKQLGIEDPQLQTELIQATGAEHQKLKYAFKGEVLDSLKKSDSLEEQRVIIEKAVGEHKQPTLEI